MLDAPLSEARTSSCRHTGLNLRRSCLRPTHRPTRAFYTDACGNTGWEHHIHRPRRSTARPRERSRLRPSRSPRARRARRSDPLRGGTPRDARLGGRDDRAFGSERGRRKSSSDWWVPPSKWPLKKACGDRAKESSSIWRCFWSTVLPS